MPLKAQASVKRFAKQAGYKYGTNRGGTSRQLLAGTIKAARRIGKTRGKKLMPGQDYQAYKQRMGSARV